MSEHDATVPPATTRDEFVRQIIGVCRTYAIERPIPPTPHDLSHACMLFMARCALSDGVVVSDPRALISLFGAWFEGLDP